MRHVSEVVGESNREIVSFRVVRACVRAVLIVRLDSAEKVMDPFSLFPFGLAAFSLFPVE